MTANALVREVYYWSSTQFPNNIQIRLNYNYSLATEHSYVAAYGEPNTILNPPLVVWIDGRIVFPIAATWGAVRLPNDALRLKFRAEDQPSPGSVFAIQFPDNFFLNTPGFIVSSDPNLDTSLIFSSDLWPFSIETTDASKAEGNSGSTAFAFTVTRSGDTSQSATVNWAVTGSGANPASRADFAGNVLPSGTVSFAAGETTKTITIEVAGDSAVEFDEGFIVMLSDPSAGALISAATAQGVIQNDDGASWLSITPTDAIEAEGNSNGAEFTFTVTRSGNTSQISTLNWSVTGSGADPASAADFAGGVMPSGTVNFGVGETSKTITIEVAGDSAVEPNEGFTVTLSAPSAETAFAAAAAQGTIQNDDILEIIMSSVSDLISPIDGQPSDAWGRSLAISSDGLSIIIGGPNDDIDAQANKGSARVFIRSEAGWVQKGAPLTPVDSSFDVSFGRSVAISANGLSAIVGGGRLGGSGSACVFDWNGTNWIERAALPIPSSNGPLYGYAVSMSADGSTVIIGGPHYPYQWQQGDALVFHWNGVVWKQQAVLTQNYSDGKPSRSDAWGHAVDISANSQVTIVSGPGNDILSSGSNEGSALSFTKLGARIGGIIVPSDAAPDDNWGWAVALSGDGLTAIIGGPGDDVGDHADQGSARVFTIHNDKWIPLGEIITPNDGQSGDRFGYSVDINYDGTSVVIGAPDAPVERSVRIFDWTGGIWRQREIPIFTSGTRNEDLYGFSVAISGDGKTIATGGYSAKVGENLRQGSVQVFNWTLPAFSISATDAVKPEGAADPTIFTFTVTRSGSAAGFASIDWKVAGGGVVGTTAADGNDFIGGVLPSGTVSFAAGETSKTITIPIAGDTTVEANETFTVSLSNPSPGLLITTGATSGTIVNDDARLSIVPLAASKAEGNGGSSMLTFTVSRTGDTAPAHTASFAVSGSGANPVNGADFVGGAVPTGTVSFGPGQASATITLAVAPDTAVEPDEGLTITLASPSAGATLGTATATGTILNDDAQLSITAMAASKPEGNTGTSALTFTVTRTGSTAAAHTATYAVLGTGSAPASAADFPGGVLPTGSVSFAAGQTTRTITIPVAADLALEADETFAVTLSNPSAGASIGTASAVGTIQNDDVPATGTLSIARIQASRAEGNAGPTPFTFAVTRSGDNSGPAWANWVVTGGGIPGTVGASTSDFGGTLPQGSVTFAVGETSKLVTVNVSGDAAVELNESFLVTLSGNPAGVTLGTTTAIATIWNDDSPGTGTLAIARSSAQKAEGQSGTTAFTFTVTRAGDLTGTAGADWAVTGGGVSNTVSANAADFAGGILPSGRVNFAAGQGLTTITVNVAADSTIELNDSFTVTLAAPQLGVTIGTAAATGVILNDDFPPSGVLSIAGLQADRGEGASGSTAFTFVVTRAGSIAGPASANWAAAAGTASAADFTGGILPSGSVTFSPGQASQVVTLTVAGDTAAEADETFTVSLSGVPTGVSIGTATATGTIRNDDPAGTGSLAIARASAQKAEGASGTTPFTFTVTRSGDLSGVAAADWVVSGGSVTGTTPATGADFATGQFPSGRVNFTAGQAIQTVTVNVTADTVAELNESFTVALSNAQNGVALATPSATGVVINDDFASTAANQTLTGTDAPDVFLLGGGLDSVVAKGALDVFRFLPTAIGPAASNAATLQDFSRVAGEVMDLSAIDAVAGTLADDPFSFIGSGAFNGTPGQLRWQDQGGGTLLIQGNINTDSTAELTIVVKANGPVDANWFVL